jgi:hypothetical protein
VLQPVVPNPVQGAGTVRFGLPRAGQATLSLYDVSGRLVARLVDRRLEAGWHTFDLGDVRVRGSKILNGVYFLRLRTNAESTTRRTVFLR